MSNESRAVVSGHDSPEQKLERLMQLSQQGDHDAFAQLCEMRRERLVAEMRIKIDRRLLPRVDASDVIQEVFWDANRRLNEVVETAMPLIAWLRFLCNQKIVDLQRKHIGAQKRSIFREQRIDAPQFNLDSIADHLVASITSPSMKAHRDDLASRVRALLATLSPLDREILTLRHFHGMSNAEVADSLGLSTNAASNRYVRALKRFKKVLDLSSDNYSATPNHGDSDRGV